MAAKLVTIARYPHPTPAHMAKSYLESHGIQCQLLDEASSVNCCGGKTDVLLKVEKAVSDRALEVLQKGKLLLFG
jgi:hypothetical protein